MTNLALEGAACSTYSLYDANKDAAQLHKLSCKATLATAMIDQEIAELEKDLQVLEARKKEILEPLEDEMERLKGNLTEYHRKLAAIKQSSCPGPRSKADSSRRIMTKLRMCCCPGHRLTRRSL